MERGPKHRKCESNCADSEKEERESAAVDACKERAQRGDEEIHAEDDHVIKVESSEGVLGCIDSNAKHREWYVQIYHVRIKHMKKAIKAALQTIGLKSAEDGDFGKEALHCAHE